jgi:hypothetical protein
MYFLAVFAFIMTVLFLFFPDTWRRERSRVYQKAVEDALKRSLKAERAAERKRQRKLARGLASTATTPAETRVGTPASTPPSTRPASLKENHDVEKASPEPHKPSAWRRWVRLPWTRNKEEDPSVVKPSFVDVNPVPTMISIFKLPTNAVVLVCSGLLFAAQYTTTYTAAITFARPPYDYNPLIIGVIVLAFGVGNIVGSVLGGRASDHILKHLAAKNGGKTVPEVSCCLNS